MKVPILILTLLTFSLSLAAQPKPNDAISKQIKILRAEKTFTLSYDPNSNVSKLMAVTENFSDRDAGKIGANAMNFAVGFMYAGQSLLKAPDSMILTFWVLTKMPRFAANHSLVISGSQADLDLGPARYVSRVRDNMEYLNFDISRANLAKIVAQPDAKVRLGEFDISFTREHIRNLSDLMTLSDPAK